MRDFFMGIFTYMLIGGLVFGYLMKGVERMCPGTTYTEQQFAIMVAVWPALFGAAVFADGKSKCTNPTAAGEKADS